STDFVIESAEVVDKGKRDTTIEIKFRKALDRDIAEEATNYIFYEEKGIKRVSGDDVDDLEGEAILKSNGKVVVLEIPEAWADLYAKLDGDYHGLKILDSIKDTKGNRLDKTYYFDFESGELLEEGQSVEEKADKDAAKAVEDLINKLPEE